MKRLNMLWIKYDNADLWTTEILFKMFIATAFNGSKKNWCTESLLKENDKIKINDKS